jgi:tRNA U34 5-methylaminomethyl-2-thiouridine-forming methyltransferase MnmC
MNASEIEVRITADGSTTLYRKDIHETYHSSHGALQEARHVFIDYGLATLPKLNKVHILEVGFGTGLNALLTALYAQNKGLKIEYHGLEAFPLEEAIWQQVNYHSLIQEANSSKIFSQMHKAAWNELSYLNNDFGLLKIHNTLQNYQAQEIDFHLIYFDAFGPRAQEEMWDVTLLKKLYETLKPGGVLTTYCAKGSFKRDLKSLGFKVESCPGPLGKREMTRAIK